MVPVTEDAELMRKVLLFTDNFPVLLVIEVELLLDMVWQDDDDPQQGSIMPKIARRELQQWNC